MEHNLILQAIAWFSCLLMATLTIPILLGHP
jgi:hypothetical protein